MTTTKIDLSRPVEAVCKRTGRVVPLGMAKPYRASYVKPGERLIKTTRSPCQTTGNETWYDDGRDYCHRDAWTLRNVAAPAAKVGDKVRCLGYAAITGKVIALTDAGQLVVQKTGSVTSSAYIVGADLRDADGDLWEVVPDAPNVTVYRNIYADGTIGSTEHRSYTDALAHTKYGKVAVGYLKQVRTTNGEIVNAAVYPRRPQLRTRSGGTVNPFA
jgi:hypothetical protein